VKETFLQTYLEAVECDAMKRGSHFQGIVAFNAYADFETRQAISFVLSFNLNISHFRSLNFMLSGC